MINKTLNSQNQAIALIRGGGYIVGSVDSTGNLSFSSNPVIHLSTTDARNECKRLAKLSTGKMYVYANLQGAELVPAQVQTFSY